MELTEEEKKIIYQMCNSLQCQMLSRIDVHIKAFDGIFGTLSSELLQWMKETNNEFKLLQSIKDKMIVKEGK